MTDLINKDKMIEDLKNNNKDNKMSDLINKDNKITDLINKNNNIKHSNKINNIEIDHYLILNHLFLFNII